jgi:plastocyanin
MRRIAALAAILATGIAVPATAGTAPLERDPVTERVKVLDDSFAPTYLKIRKDDRVKYAWSDENINTHNVTLMNGPKGVKKGCPKKGPDAYSKRISICNKSGNGRSDIKFKKRFDVRGTYEFVCTLHFTEMTMTVRVGR